MTGSLLLQAFEGTNQTVPVWFMRQAGRYLPQYQALRREHSLDELFAKPELAAEITCMPIETLGVDAAILFADILTLPKAMGFKVHFDNSRGPLIQSPWNDNDIKDIGELPDLAMTIRLAVERLENHIPLIGFAGSPFTVLTYLIEGGSSNSFLKTLRFIAEDEKSFHSLMGRLTDNTIRYYRVQKEAGIRVFQLFDTWAGILRPTDYAHWVLPYAQRIFNAVDLPSIYFIKNTAHLLPLADQCGADFLSVDHTVVLGHNNVIDKTKKGIQGNLYNGLLYSDEKTLDKEINDVLAGGIKHERFIFNLSHGVFPDTDVNKLKYIVDRVHAFSKA